ncbi:transposase-like protein [Rhizobium leguminosarum]
MLDEIVQTRSYTKAAKCPLTRLLNKQATPPKRVITDKLRSNGAAKRQLMLDVEHRSHKGLNNRAEFSPAVQKTAANATGLMVGWLNATFRVDLLRRPKPLRPIFPLDH